MKILKMCNYKYWMWCKAQPIRDKSYLYLPSKPIRDEPLHPAGQVQWHHVLLRARNKVTLPGGLWVTRRIFLEWYKNYLCSTVLCVCKKNELLAKTLLLLDSAPGHAANLSEIKHLWMSVLLTCHQTPHHFCNHWTRV